MNINIINKIINKSEFLNEVEKEFWSKFSILLSQEKLEQLAGFIGDYEKMIIDLKKRQKGKLSNLNRKHIQEWKEFIRNEKSKTLEMVQNKIKEVENKKLEKIYDKLKE